MSIITLTTDFGHGSAYVAQMKGVILGISPQANIVDITHGIGPQDVLAGAFVLGDAAFHFPAGTIHVAVIDPGVGTDRAIVGARIDGHWFIAPDNGLLSGVLIGRETDDVRSLENRALWRPEVSDTFHGRDIMAPVAAHLFDGVDAESIGSPHGELMRLPWPRPKLEGNRIQGEVVFVDSLGNLITNILRADLAAWTPRADIMIECGGHAVHGVARTYADRSPGSLLALFGSSGRLEIAEVNGNAARAMDLGVGEQVTLRRQRTK